MEWVALQMNEDTLIWCFSPDTEPGIIERLEKKVEILGKTVKQIMVTDIPKILDNISFDMGSARFFITSNVNNLSFPIDLQQRVFWISKELKLKGKFNEQQAINLLKFKFAYEQEHGFDNLSGETTLKTHTSELPELLYDPLTFRGTRMLDIAIRKNPIMINIRFRDYSLQTSNELALSAIREFSDVYKKISEITMS